jgi:uncharacterized protein (TIGR00255 family)
MKSMTAYAQTSLNLNGKKYRLELQTLNKKGLDIQVDIPYAFSHLNVPIRLFFSNHLERGSVFFRLKEELVDKTQISLEDLAIIKQRLESMAQNLGYSQDQITFSMLLEKASSMSGVELDFESLQSSLQTLLKQLVKMRQDEGSRLKLDLQTRLHLIQNTLSKVETLQDGSLKHVKDKLIERLHALDVPSIDEDRLMKEVIYYVEKQDVTEEITRLKSHLVQFSKILEETTPVGRKLEFLVQECFRELNTLSAKTSELESINHTLLLKNEFEKIKEQIMNIE